ncbi:MAG: type II toxin-antitoxin system mRNA interferase toxin, RelE/StbE family [Candidatus Micrarchaeota archaeon]
MYSLEIEEKVDRIFSKMKNKLRLEIIDKKIQQILENPQRFKPLRSNMHGLREVHIDKSFVLLYVIDEPTKTVRIVDFDHHDNVFRH